MFKFDDLDAMGRAVMLLKQQEAKRYWKQLYNLQGVILAWGTKTSELITLYQNAGGKDSIIDALKDASVKGKVTYRNIEKQLVRLDEYMQDMDTRLSDGSKWYNAQDIQKMADSIQEDN